MPEFITEEQYLAVQDVIDNPPPGTTDYHVAEWKKHQNRYKDQQFRAGIKDLTPNTNAQKVNEKVNKLKTFAEIYNNGYENFDATNEPNAQFLTTPGAIAYKVNNDYLTTIYGEGKITPENHDFYRTDFAKRFLGREDILDDIQFWDATKEFTKKQATDIDKEINAQSAAVAGYYEGKSLSQAIADNPDISPGVLREVYSSFDAVINPYRPNIDKALDALERKTKSPIMEEYIAKTGKTKEEIVAEDEKALQDLNDVLLKTHPNNRSKIIKKITGEAVQRGKATREDVRNVLNEAVDAALNVFEGLDATQAMDTEVFLKKITFEQGDEVISDKVSEITTPEQARTYLMSKLRETIDEAYNIPRGRGPRAGGLPTEPVLPNRFKLDQRAISLLRDAKADLQSTIEFERTARSLNKAVDPFREGWQTDIASTLGSSLGIMGIYSAAGYMGPAGTLFATNLVSTMYTGLNYEQTREKYPDLDPEKARNVALVSGGLEALLDLGQYKIISKALSKLPFTKALARPSASTIGGFAKKAAIETGKTYGFEFGIEMIQEGMRPVVQSIFAAYDEEYQINSQEEWADWTAAAPHIAIGMIPLAVFAGLGSAARSKSAFSDRAFKKAVMQEGALTNFGLNEAEVVEIQELVNNNMFNAARERLKELNNDASVITRRGEVLESLLAQGAVDRVRAYEEARNEGIIPSYSVNNLGQYTLEDGTVLPDQAAYIQHTRAKIVEAEKQYAQEVARNIETYTEQEGKVGEGVDIEMLQERTALLGRLNGLSDEELTTYDNIFGSNEIERSDTYEQLIKSIIDEGPVQGIQSYISGVYDNMPGNIRDALGETKEEGVKNLYRLIIGQSAAVRREGDKTGSSIAIQEAEQELDFQSGLDRTDQASIDLFRRRVIAAKKAEGKKQKAQPLDFVSLSEVQNTANGQYIKAVVDLLESNYNVRFTFVRGQKINDKYIGPVGLSMGNDIIIDIDQARGSLLSHVLGHEFGHYLQNFDDIYKEVSDAIVNNVSGREYKRFSNMIREAGVPDNIANDEAKIEEYIRKEFVSDVFGSRFRDIKFWEKLSTAMYEQNQTKADTLVGILRRYLGDVKKALLDYTQRNIPDAEFIDFKSMESGIIGAMLKARKKLSDGTKPADTMAATPDPENRHVEYVARKLRDQLNAAFSQIREAGGIAEGRKRLLESIIDPQTEEQYDKLVQYRQQSINRRMLNERTEGTNIGRTLRTISKKLYNALLKGEVSAKLIAEAEAAMSVVSRFPEISGLPKSLTFDEVGQIKANPNEKIAEYIETFYEVRSASINGFVKNRLKPMFESLFKNPEFAKLPSNIQEVYRDIFDAMYSDVHTVKGKVSAIYNQLYTPDNVPAQLDQEQFERLLTQYSVYKTFAGWESRAIDERETIINKAIKWGREAKLDFDLVNPRSEEMVSNGIEEVLANVNIIKRGFFAKLPVTSALVSYANDHVAFASMLEVISPSLNTPGRAITPELQALSDKFYDSYHTIQDEVHENQDTFIAIVQKIFKTKNHKKIVHGLVTKKDVRVVLNGENVKLTKAYAAYILNIADQFIYKKQLEKAGYTTDVLASMQDQIGKEVNDLRQRMRKELITTIRRTNKKYAKIGKSYVDPAELFYPVEKKALTNNVIDSFDIAFGVGIQPDTVDSIIRARDEIQLNTEDQTINLFSMYASHNYKAIHAASLADAVNIAKRIFSHPEVRDKLEKMQGPEAVVKIFSFISALEAGGTINAEIQKSTAQLLNALIGGAARGTLGLNLKTYAVNLMSGTNMLQDASIPVSIKGQAFLNTIRGLFSGKDRGIKSSKVISRRLRAGANALLQITKGDPTIDSPNIIRRLGDLTMRWIGNIDSYALGLSAMTAYEAHSLIGKQEGLSGEALHKFAVDGMVRTITKTSQPNMAATKALIEQTSSPYVRMLTLFMSEVRKTFGLEYTALKKMKVKPGEAFQIVLINHLLLGSMTWLLRESAGWLMGEGFADDEDELESFIASILFGPLSGLLIVGDLFTGVFKLAYNAFFPDHAVRVYLNTPAPIRTVMQIDDIKNSFNGDKPWSERISSAGGTLEAIGSLINSGTTSTVGSLLDFAGEVTKATIERE